MNKEQLINVLKERFESHMDRHRSIVWENILNHLEGDVLDSVMYMEETGGQPDLVVLGGLLIYTDCSKESPKGRRGLCYDEQARLHRKKFPPLNSVMALVEKHHLKLISEEMYLALQKVFEFDCKSSSWVLTGTKLRQLGGAIFGLKRYDRVFIYHNGADAYYKDRGFRAYISLEINN